MTTVLMCAALALVCLGVFYLWGWAFLRRIGARCLASECVCFGFIVMHVVYQALYLPFFLTRGSYKTLSILWFAVSSTVTVLCLCDCIGKRTKRRRKRRALSTKLSFLVAVALVACLCLVVGLHPRYYQDDGYYINWMNLMVYRDTIFVSDGALYYHSGFNGFFGLFSTLCLVTGISPFYMALFTMRFLCVALTAVVACYTGQVFIGGSKRRASAWALALAVLVPLSMMCWSSMYTGMFLWMRSNESKAYCLTVLLPLAFAVCAELFVTKVSPVVTWKKQLAIGLAAVPVAASAMMAYPVLIIVFASALLVYDRFQHARRTILRALACIAPNLVYMLMYQLLY